MRVSLVEVREVFDGLLRGRSREDASAWAFERLRAADARELTFDPPAVESRILEALKFLGGVDMITDMDGSYLFGPADFEQYRP